MGRRRLRQASRKTYLAILPVIAITALLLPAEWTGKLISLAQIIVPFQHAAAVTADSVGQALRPNNPTVSPEEHEALERKKTALEHQVAALTVRVAELEKEVDILTATRLWDAGGQRIGARGRLIPARVITDDLLPWRSSQLINAGTLQGVQRGSAVTSRLFTVDQGDADGLDNGMAVLLGEVFVGIVEQVGTHTARVKLLNDVSVQMKVRVGRLTDGGFVPLENYFWLVGRGDGVMEIRDAKRRDVEAGLIQVGDVVLSDPTSGILPCAMTIGRITSIGPDRDNPLLSILTVGAAVDETSLRRIYVYEPEIDTGKGADGTHP